MTSEELTILRKSWRKATENSDIAVDIYNRLFFLKPALRPLFQENVGTQAQILIARFTYIVENMNNWETLQGELRELGLRHVGYGVTPQDYIYHFDALVYGLTVHLGELDNEAVALWRKFYWTIVGAMLGDQFEELKHTVQLD